MGEQRPARFGYVDGLRGVAALMVVLAHSAGLFAFPEANAASRHMIDVAEYGGRGVQIFFVISGFVIAYSLRNATRETFGLGAFILRRSVRLDPPYWCSILALFAARAVQAIVAHKPIWKPSLPQLAAHLVYLQAILGYQQICSVFWTLCIEFQLYLVFAIILVVTERFASGEALDKKVRPAVVTAAFLASVVLAHTVWPNKGLGTWFVPYWYMFLSGVLICWQMLGRVSNRHVALCLAFMVGAYALNPDSYKLAAILAVAAIELGLRLNRMHVWLSGRVAQYLGKLSYGIYLLHVPVSVIVMGLRTRVAPTSNVVSFVMLGVMYALTIVAAHVLYATVEAPCLRLSARLKDGVAPLFRAAALRLRA